MSDVTTLLRCMSGPGGGDPDRLLRLVYDELHRVAARLMQGEGRDHTLCATALVNEAWLRLGRIDGSRFEDRRHFLSVAAEAMRRLLVDHARGRRRERRGGDWQRITLGGIEPRQVDDPEEFLALDDALRRLTGLDPRMGQVVRLRFFAGLSVEETAEVLSVSPRTVKREWTLARAWLFHELGPGRD